MTYQAIEKFLEKYEGQIALITAKKYGLFFVSVYYQGDLDKTEMKLIAEVGRPTLDECMAQLEIQIGRGDLY